MSFPNNSHLTVSAGGSTGSSLLAPQSPFARVGGSLETSSFTSHPMPLKCRTPSRSATPVQPPMYISALDHLSTKLRIPMTAVEPTLALEDDGLVPGICRLYLEGRCRQGERCYQVHANPMVIEQLRQEALSAPSCCHSHGAECNYEGFPLGLTVTLEPPKERAMNGPPLKVNTKTEENGISTDDTSSTVGSKENNAEEPESTPSDPVVSLHSLCPTSYLWQLYSASGQMHLRVPRNKICREHRKGLCRFGSACSFLHICRQIPLERERPRESVDTSRGTHLFGAPVNRPVCRSQGPTSLNDHFGGHSSHTLGSHTLGSHYGNGSSVPLHFGGDQSASFSRPASKPLLTPSQPVPGSNGHSEPLLRPVSQTSSPQLAASGRQHGSFSHNPYADASSFQ